MLKETNNAQFVGGYIKKKFYIHNKIVVTKHPETESQLSLILLPP